MRRPEPNRPPILARPSRRRRRPRAFTPIEVLVALAVVGLLVALLIPAVRAARRAADRAACRNNLRQLGLGLDHYLATFAVYPTGQPPGYGRSVFVAILGGLDQQPLADAFNFQVDPSDIANFTVEIGRPGVLVCPSDPGTAPLLDGGPQAYASDPDPPGGSRPVAASSYGVMAGTFISEWLARPAPTYDPYGQINGCFNVLPDITPASITDGLATTIFVAERAAGFVNEDRINPMGRWTASYIPATLVHAWDAPNGVFRAWSDPLYRAGAIGMEIVSSRHGGGAHVLLGDGSARFIRESIDCWPIDPKTHAPVGIIQWYDGFKDVPRPGVWQALATRAGGEAPGEF